MVMVVARNRGRGEWLVFLAPGCIHGVRSEFLAYSSKQIYSCWCWRVNSELWRPGVKINGGRKFSEIKV